MTQQEEIEPKSPGNGLRIDPQSDLKYFFLAQPFYLTSLKCLSIVYSTYHLIKILY